MHGLEYVFCVRRSFSFNFLLVDSLLSFDWSLTGTAILLVDEGQIALGVELNALVERQPGVRKA